jgi:predicted alpha/beta-hydrolase family hydrolase
VPSPTEFRVAAAAFTTTALAYRADEAGLNVTLILAHGAGAGQRSPFIVSTAQALAARGVDTVTFNFPYIEQSRRLPDRRPVLEDCYRRVIETVRETLAGTGGLYIGGKSMGGRIATQVAAFEDGPPVSGIVLLGYPLHPPGRASERRDAHFPSIRCPILFVQGSRDAFGTPEELDPAMAMLPQKAALHVVAGGDHSFKIARASREAQTAALGEVYRVVAEWIERTTNRDRRAREARRPRR